MTYFEFQKLDTFKKKKFIKIRMISYILKVSISKARKLYNKYKKEKKLPIVSTLLLEHNILLSSNLILYGEDFIHYFNATYSSKQPYIFMTDSEILINNDKFNSQTHSIIRLNSRHPVKTNDNYVSFDKNSIIKIVYLGTYIRSMLCVTNIIYPRQKNIRPKQLYKQTVKKSFELQNSALHGLSKCPDYKNIHPQNIVTWGSEIKKVMNYSFDIVKKFNDDINIIKQEFDILTKLDKYKKKLSSVIDCIDIYGYSNNNNLCPAKYLYENISKIFLFEEFGSIHDIIKYFDKRCICLTKCINNESIYEFFFCTYDFKDLNISTICNTEFAKKILSKDIID